jgi:exodeoxyribonuclease-3
MGIKISSWNVNGYRAIYSKGFRNWVDSSDADVICLQEIKVQTHQLTEEQLNYPAYSSIYWNPAQKPGYSGVATLCKQAPSYQQNGLERDEFDREGRVCITKFPGFTLFNIYFPNGQRGHDRVEYKLNFYEHLLNHVQALRLAGEEVILTGDFNTAHTEIDLAHPKENADTSGFLPEERAMVDKYLRTGLIDIFRYLYPDKVQYTWWTYITGARKRNIGWRIDYFLITPGLVDRVVDAVIHDDIQGSDHCPVSLLLK